ncbi:AtzE family amidohydrolase [Cupriavidus basilensis]|uniref:AtzE family amidohydrolase n=1 Tax=Cupriavidus basilensis TaxID=68895 RepID=A0A643FPG0_9BURK|nr:AtzE family amidohydrolase [Cupriavidus basilensis]QOT80009.1 AtzE family amidohydrolase [Cupriavidus basilensis]
MNARDPVFESALAIRSDIDTGARSALDVATATLARIEACDPLLHAFTAVTRERALGEARRVDALRAQGARLPPLAGVPYAVKNLFDVADLTTLAGSRVLAGAAPARRDAVLVSRMREAGAVLVGTLNMDEFAYGFTTENAHRGTCRNPHDLARVAGGSSGGSAAAVAAGLVPLSLGSDTNGSIRVPAALTGIFGLKPTYGRLSRRGSYPFVHSLDHVGHFARSVADLAAAYDMLQFADTRDPACARRPLEAVSGQAPIRVRAARLGGYFDDMAAADARAAAQRVADALEATGVIHLPGAAAARSAAFVITGTEGGHLHREHLRHQYAQMEPLSRDRLAAGLVLPAAWYVRAQQVRAAFRQELLDAFARTELLIAPATPVAAPLAGQESIEINGQVLPARASLGLLTQPISCIGLPVLTVPLAGPDGLPLGVQLIAPPWREDLAFAAAQALEAMGVAACPRPSALLARAAA